VGRSPLKRRKCHENQKRGRDGEGISTQVKARDEKVVDTQGRFSGIKNTHLSRKKGKVRKASHKRTVEKRKEKEF